MSAATLDALKAAIDRHVCDQSPGSVIGAFVLVVETTNLDDLDEDQGSLYAVTEGNAFTCTGLVEAYRRRERTEQTEDNE